MNFGQALHLLKHGKKVSREGWNGKGMYIYLLKFPDPNETDALNGVELEPCICMYTAQGKHQPGWLASQPDILSNDWGEVK